MVELKQLRIFLAVADQLHFGRAAEKLHMAQPALSAQMRNLESQLGVTLFFRTTRTVRLTRAGEAFLPEAKAALAQVDVAVASARAMAAEGKELLKLGGVDSATAGLLPSVVRRFRRLHPDIEIKITEMLSAPALHELANRHLDIAFSRIEPLDDNFCSRHVMTEPIVAALPADHAMAEADEVPLEALAGMPLVISARAHRPILFDVIHQFFRDHGFEPHILQEANERHMIIAMVAAGLGLSLVPSWVTQFSRDDVVYRPIAEGSPQVDVHVVWRRHDPLRVVHTFIETLPDHYLGSIED